MNSNCGLFGGHPSQISVCQHDFPGVLMFPIKLMAIIWRNLDGATMFFPTNSKTLQILAAPHSKTVNYVLAQGLIGKHHVQPNVSRAFPPFPTCKHHPARSNLTLTGFFEKMSLISTVADIEKPVSNPSRYSPGGMGP